MDRSQIRSMRPIQKGKPISDYCLPAGINAHVNMVELLRHTFSYSILVNLLVNFITTV